MSAAPALREVITRRGRERAREVWTGVKVANCTAEQIEQANRAGYEPGAGDALGYFVGRDPRQMEPEEFEAMGHERMSPMEAIRAKCLDCCAGSPHEVALCVAMACPSWPFRMGKNPWRAPISEERREALRRSSPFSSKPHKIEASDAESLPGGQSTTRPIIALTIAPCP
jgi:hypothetical protein